MTQLAAFGILISLAFVATAAPIAPQAFKLDNGLTLIVQEDHRAPVVVSQLWYKTGASYEHAGITGISHLLEHMMFKGTANHGPGEFSRLIAREGGRENAFTGRDYTAYFQRLEKSRLGVALELEADRMRHLRLDGAELEKERQVVLEERRLRTEDNPRALTNEAFYATAFQTSPYRHPIIGWQQDIQAISIDDLRAWYRRWYAPDNAVLVIAGDVKTQAIRELVEHHFGAIPATTTVPVVVREEVPQRGAKRLQVAAPARLPYLLLGYKSPSLKTAAEPWEAYALTMLAGILDGDDSSRLARELVRGSEIAAGASASYSLYQRLDSLLVLGATPAANTEMPALEQALRNQVTKLRDEAVSERELARIKTQVIAGNVYERDSIFYQAMQLGMLETIGLGWQRRDEFVAGVSAITAAQVQAVARKYLRPEHATVAVLKPQQMDGDEHGK